MRKTILQVAAASMFFLFGYWCHGYYDINFLSRSKGKKELMNREILYDTMVVSLSVPPETIYTGRYIPVPVSVRDTVYVERESRIYRDTSYYAIVSGFSPSLDSLVIFPRHTVETYSAFSPPPPSAARSSRWGLGITAGAAVTPRGVSPGVTIGLTYTITSF